MTDWEAIETAKRKITMSQQIAKKDGEYGIYAGALLSDAETRALLETLDENKDLFNLGMDRHINFLKSWLNHKRKAFLASTGSEVTKLGFILGVRETRVTGKTIRASINRLRESSKKTVPKTGS